MARAKTKATEARQLRWSEKRMTQADKEWTRERLTKVAEQHGGFTQEQAKKMCSSSTISDYFRGEGRPAPADVVWSWIAEAQDARSPLVPCDLERRSSAKHAQPIARWRLYAQVRSGWHRSDEVTRCDVEAMELADSVLAVLWREQEGLEFSDWQDNGKMLWMHHGTARKGWLCLSTLMGVYRCS